MMYRWLIQTNTFTMPLSFFQLINAAQNVWSLQHKNSSIVRHQTLFLPLQIKMEQIDVLPSKNQALCDLPGTV